ncbi:Tryptophan--tRNA ligase [Buchnera aphidicola (Thelaxes suberi)]|uniref:tryptophan--tRNA ligase n=1 Tax=Buchnera aphidicola TaxID=9 RepID=UPI0034644DA1
MKKKKIVFSAIQPSGRLTLANYIGTMQHWEKMQIANQCIYCIADLHAITGLQNKSVNLLENILDTLALYLAIGIDPKKSIIFLQSDVLEHCQFYWILNCHTYYGELLRMNQFKQKSKTCSNRNNINTGLLNYPILMASDILLYKTDLVPMGVDQTQHLELTRNIAKRINFIFKKEILVVPQAYISTLGSKIMSLSDPLVKMSKSDKKEDSTIFLFDSLEDISRKINKAITDSDYPPKIYYNFEKKPGISNLLEIVSAINNSSISSLVSCFSGKTYQEFKSFVILSIFNKLNLLQKNYLKWRKNEHLLFNIARTGANKAKKIAISTLQEIYFYLKLN